MATRPDIPSHVAVRAAAELLERACAGAAAVLFHDDKPPARRRPRSKR
jgi:hypothetical protein